MSASFPTQDLVKLADELHGKLAGSCEPVPDEVYEVPGLAELLDERVLLCELCGWWFEADEVSHTHEGNACVDCCEEQNLEES